MPILRSVRGLTPNKTLASLRSGTLGLLLLALGACSSLSGPSDVQWDGYAGLIGQPVEISFGLYDPPTSVLTVETVCGTLIEHSDSQVVLGPVRGKPRCQTLIPAFVRSGHVTLESVEPLRLRVRRAHVGSIRSLFPEAGWPILWVAIVTDESALPPDCISVGAFSLASQDLLRNGVNYVVAGGSPGGPYPLEGEAFRCPQ